MIKRVKGKGITVILLPLFLCIAYIFGKMKEKEASEYKENFKRMNYVYAVANQWIKTENCGEKIESPLIEKGYRKIAIYGMGELGQRLTEKFETCEGIDVLYGIDRNAENLSLFLPVYLLETALQKEIPDIIILTTYCKDNELLYLLREKFTCPVWTIEELLNAAK